MFLWVVYDDMLCIEPVNNCSDSFWVIGDQNWVFGWKRVRICVNFLNCQMMLRSSKHPFTQARAKRAPSEHSQTFVILVRSSERQANQTCTFVNWVRSSEQSFAQANWVLWDHFVNFATCFRALIWASYNVCWIYLTLFKWWKLYMNMNMVKLCMFIWK